MKMAYSTAVDYSPSSKTVAAADYSPASKNAAAIDISTERDPEWSPDLDPDDLRELQEAQLDPSRIVAKLPRESVRLGYYSALCLVSNRMIGTGIFNSASIVFPNTQSIGLSLILWVLGAIFALAGVIVYIELGLTIPRWPCGPNGEKLSTPRSGDALNYFNYMLKKPLFLATCLYGIAFMILENASQNSVAFAQNVLDASHAQVTPGKICAIAISTTSFCCLLHASSRKWGIILNNFFGTVKFFILVFIVIIGFVWTNRDVANSNLDISTSFSMANSPKSPYPYAEAFLFVIMPYGCFHQLNYVISEVDRPKKTFPRASFYGVLVVAIMYTAVNFIYAASIPKQELFTPGGIDVGARFIQLTLGQTSLSSSQLQTFWLILKAISAFGNLIVVTFTAARVKQEIAKEGIFPYSLILAKSYHFSLSRLFRRESLKADVNSVYSEDTPAAMLFFHWAVSTILTLTVVFAIQPQPYSSTPAYTVLSGLLVYVTNIIKFSCIAFGLLWLRFSPKVRWADKSQLKHPVLSIIAALTLLVLCVFPLIFIWVPDPGFPSLSRSSGLVSWFVVPTGGLGILCFAFLYWVLFRCYVLVRSARDGTTLQVKREPKFKAVSEGLTQVVEIVTLQWVKEVGMTLAEIEETSHTRQGQSLEYSRRALSPVYSNDQWSIDEAEIQHYPRARVPSELPGLHRFSELP